MEQARYWMWAKRKSESNLHGDSWEEQAFAEDAAGTLGGCVWPPRSYSCSFCRREFRSAQALGGHMNVHRRDRARLKQSEIVVPQNNLNPCTSFDVPDYPSPSQILRGTNNFLYNSNPNPDFSELTRVSSPPITKVNTREENMATFCFLSSPLVQKNDAVISPRRPSWSSFVSEKRDSVLGERSSINIVVCTQSQTNASSDEEVASCKRRRIAEKNP
ncbi:hypothetical protein DH2020_046025 [Rehmannia glutinosa]|uniref:C2H2-type domain-containing protein n=1 Tax=Rehmannia glutinosa TaxID=99300 RepID=A0ABR0UCS3_REHGL